MELADEIRSIRKDLDTLVLLFSKLINKIVPEEEAEEKDKEAIASKEEIIDEEEFFKTLK